MRAENPLNLFAAPLITYSGFIFNPIFVYFSPFLTLLLSISSPGRECRSDADGGEARCVCRVSCPEHWKPVGGDNTGRIILSVIWIELCVYTFG